MTVPHIRSVSGVTANFLTLITGIWHHLRVVFLYGARVWLSPSSPPFLWVNLADWQKGDTDNSVPHSGCIDQLSRIPSSRVRSSSSFSRFSGEIRPDVLTSLAQINEFLGPIYLLIYSLGLSSDCLAPFSYVQPAWIHT
jgi:hypothetical protein